MDSACERSGQSPAGSAAATGQAVAAESPLTPSRGQLLALAALAVLTIGACVVLLVCGQVEAPLVAAGGPREGDAPALILVNVNQADWPELSLVPGLGKALSQKIVALRAAKGPLASLDELLEVNGIGAVKLENLRPYLTVGDGRLPGGAGEGERQGHVGLSTGQ